MKIDVKSVKMNACRAATINSRTVKAVTINTLNGITTYYRLLFASL